MSLRLATTTLSTPTGVSCVQVLRQHEERASSVATAPPPTRVFNLMNGRGSRVVSSILHSTEEPRAPSSGGCSTSQNTSLAVAAGSHTRCTADCSLLAA